MAVGKLKKGLQKMKAKILKKQVKRLLKELEEAEKELDTYIETHPELLEDEEFVKDYREIKKVIEEMRDYGQKILEKKNVNMEEFVGFVNYFGEVAERLGKKYGSNIADKAGRLKEVRIDRSASTFDAGELSEEELRRLAEELRKKNVG